MEYKPLENVGGNLHEEIHQMKKAGRKQQITILPATGWKENLAWGLNTHLIIRVKKYTQKLKSRQNNIIK